MTFAYNFWIIYVKVLLNRKGRGQRPENHINSNFSRGFFIGKFDCGNLSPKYLLALISVNNLPWIKINPIITPRETLIQKFMIIVFCKLVTDWRLANFRGSKLVAFSLLSCKGWMKPLHTYVVKNEKRTTRLQHY